MNGFKEVNDRHGHAAGDEVLRGFAHRLTLMLRLEDTVARVGGDEFVIALMQIRDLHDAEFVARRILVGLSRPYTVESHEVAVGISIGIAVFPEHGETQEELTRRADEALCEAKLRGKSWYVVAGTATHRRADFSVAAGMGRYDAFSQSTLLHVRAC